MAAEEDAPPARLATEWTVEAKAGGTCVVRMVMSGFGTEAAWDKEIEGMGEGMERPWTTCGDTSPGARRRRRRGCWPPSPSRTGTQPAVC